MTFTERDPAGRHGWDRHPGVRTGGRLGAGERAADLVCRVVGSWTYLLVVAAAVTAGSAAAWAADRPVGAVLVAVGWSALATVHLSLMFVVARRADRVAADLALYWLDQVRRSTAIAEDLRDDLARLHGEVARIAAEAAAARHGLGGPRVGG